MIVLNDACPFYPFMDTNLSILRKLNSKSVSVKKRVNSEHETMSKVFFRYYGVEKRFFFLYNKSVVFFLIQKEFYFCSCEEQFFNYERN